ncbi:hypothetical protein HII36_13520 [Nonomuraea sp. NN258]|uniref:hypothetical protein n=1 Tax=Nonomuraea antri TaxID=2730852 RepID=UPI0015684E21|nr:hypothetical protein [Nonomuraea antri]NRQ32852.1 hypothetical protein [Nonomuraea antri]
MESLDYAPPQNLIPLALAVAAIALLAAAAGTGRARPWRPLGGPWTMALVGACFMLSALVIAFADLGEDEQALAFTGPRLRTCHTRALG